MYDNCKTQYSQKKLLIYNICDVNFLINADYEVSKKLQHLLYSYNCKNDDSYDSVSINYEISIFIDNSMFQKKIDSLKKSEYIRVIIFKDKEGQSEYGKKYNIDANKIVLYELSETIVEIKDNKIIIIFNETVSHFDRIVLRIIREICFRTNVDNNYELFHSAVVRYKDRGIMIIGNKKAGKSTLMSHFLNIGGEYVSNDLAFISITEKSVIAKSMPNLIKVGSGTFKKFQKYSHYVDNIELTTKQKNYDLVYDKFLITPYEITQIFDVKFRNSTQIDYIIHSNLSFDSNVIRCKEISKEYLKNLYDDLIITRKTKWGDPWLVGNTKIMLDDEFIMMFEDKIQQSNCKLLSLTYGTEIESEELISKIL